MCSEHRHPFVVAAKMRPDHLQDGRRRRRVPAACSHSTAAAAAATASHVQQQAMTAHGQTSSPPTTRVSSVVACLPAAAAAATAAAGSRPWHRPTRLPSASLGERAAGMRLQGHVRPSCTCAVCCLRAGAGQQLAGCRRISLAVLPDACSGPRCAPRSTSWCACPTAMQGPAVCPPGAAALAGADSGRLHQRRPGGAGGAGGPLRPRHPRAVAPAAQAGPGLDAAPHGPGV